MNKIQFEEEHGVTTNGTFQGIVAKGMEYGLPPVIKGKKYFVLFL